MPHHKFWQRHPALLYAVSLLIGASAALFWQFPWNWVFPIVWTLYLCAIKKHPQILLLPAIFTYCWFFYANMPPTQETEGIFSIQSLQTHNSPFQSGYAYKGTFYLSSAVVPCTIYSLKSPPFATDIDYFLSGTLEQRAPYDYAFKPKTWVPLPDRTFNGSHIRYRCKQAYRQFLETKLHLFPRTADFFLP